MEKHLKQLYVLVIENSTLSALYPHTKYQSKWEMQKSIKKLLSFIFW